MNLLKDRAFLYVIFFGVFLYIGIKLLPYKETLFPLMSIGNILLMSLFTVILAVNSIKFPKYTTIKHCLFMVILLNFMFFLIATLAFSDLGGYFDSSKIIVYAGGIQTAIAIACILYIMFSAKSRSII